MSYLASETKLGGLYCRPDPNRNLIYTRVDANSITNDVKREIIKVEEGGEIVYFASTTQEHKSQVAGLVMLHPQTELVKLQADFYLDETCVMRRFENKWIDIMGLVAITTRTIFKDISHEDFFIIPFGTGLYRKLTPEFAVNLKNGVVSKVGEISDLEVFIVEAEFYDVK